MVEMGRYATALDCNADAAAQQASLGAARHSALSHAPPMVMPNLSRRDQRDILARTVEFDVIPHLLLMRTPAAATAVAAITEANVADLAVLTLGIHEQATGAFVSALRAQGVAAEALYLELLAPVARRLGEWWEQDICDFTQVTTGLWRLQSAMRDLSPAFLSSACFTSAPRQGQAPKPRILLVPLPGEQHTFGLSMVYDFFVRAGWNAWSGPVSSSADLAAIVRSQWVDVLGFSLACDERLDAAQAEIAAVRRASRNPGLAVIVGGPPFVVSPGLAACIGADGTAGDGLQAVAAANALLKRQERP